MKKWIIAVCFVVSYSVAYAEAEELISPLLSAPLGGDSQYTLKLNDIPSESISGVVLNRDNVTELVNVDPDNDDVVMEEEGDGSLIVKVNGKQTGSTRLNSIGVFLQDGTQLTVPLQKAYSSACSWLTFSSPTKTSKVSGCSYGSTSCYAKGKYHTGTDYSYSSSYSGVYATADGKIVRIEYMNSSDHGMGTNIIIEHTLSTCSKVYSTYSHLSSVASGMYVGKPVTRGTKIGTMGGSGKGNPNYWSKHLHFEIKTKAVTYNPCGSGTYWGYTPSSPSNYCYKNPANF